MADPPTLGQVPDQGGGPAGHGPAVEVTVVGPRRVQPIEQAVARTAGAKVDVAEAHLVIADQGHAGAVQGEAGHAVHLAGGQQAVVHDLAGAGDDAVRKAFRQVEHALRIRPERAIALDLVAIGVAGGGVAEPGVAGEGEGGGAGGEQAAA